jgi:hypothetical protein
LRNHFVDMFSVWLDARDKLFEMLARVGYIPQGNRRLDLAALIAGAVVGGSGDNNHNVGIGGKGVNVSVETTVFHLHGLELTLGLPATQFELFDNVTNLFKPVRIDVATTGRHPWFHGRGLGNDEKSRPLEQDDFRRLTNLPKTLQVRLEHANVRNKIGHNFTPGLVEGFIPNTRRERAKVGNATRFTGLLNALYIYVD